MLIGYITQDGAVQTDSMITTVQIPAQNYEYMTITDISPDNIFGTWDALNKMPYSALTRNYGYDLDMYNEAHTEMTIALSVDPDF